MTSSTMNDLPRCATEARRLAEAMALPSNQTGSSGLDTRVREARASLIDSAARVLKQAIDDSGQSLDAAAASAAADREAAPLGDQVWELTCAVTALSVTGGLDSSVDEATAALQAASCLFVEPGTDVGVRIHTLREMQRVSPVRLLLRPNGPYVATNLEALTNWLGERVAAPPQVALCRCGGSAIKPFCDGGPCAEQFNDAKDPKRVADRKDTYAGQQLTVVDNRGTCAHSGFCTDRLASVFHQDKDRSSHERSTDGRDHPSREGLPVGRAELRRRRTRGSRSRRRRSASGGGNLEGRTVPCDRWHPARRSKRRDGLTKCRCVAGAFQPLSVRPLAEQTILQWDALVHPIP